MTNPKKQEDTQRNRPEQHDAAHYQRIADAHMVDPVDPVAVDPVAVDPEKDDDAPEIVNPLAITRKNDLPLGWIREYAEMVSEMTGSPYEFNELSALTIVATALQRKARLHMSFGEIYPNIYGCIIAPSSVYHKSSALNKVSHLLSRAFYDKLLLANQSTPEGLAKSMERQPEGIIIRDEIGTLFSSHKVKYMASLKQDLTRIYDNQPWRKQLSNESITIDKPYLNILGATTPTRFYEAVDQKDWRDGFIVRWLFVLPEGEPDFDSMTGLYEQKHDQKIGELAMRIANFAKMDVTNFTLAEGALDIWDTWQKAEAKKGYYYDSDITAPVIMRYSTYALKFALILSAVNGTWGTISRSTMQTSIDLANNYKHYVYRLMDEKSEYSVSGGKLQKIMIVVNRLYPQTNGQGVATRVIMQHSNMKAAEVKPCLEVLVEHGALSEERVGRGFRYVPHVMKLSVKI